MFNLKNWLEEAVANINPFDNGATAATVSAARRRNRPAPAQTISRPRPQPQPRQQGLDLGNAFKQFGNFAGDVNKATYGTAQKLLKEAVIDPTVKTAESVGKGIGYATGGLDAIEKENRRADEELDTFARMHRQGKIDNGQYQNFLKRSANETNQLRRGGGLTTTEAVRETDPVRQAANVANLGLTATTAGSGSTLAPKLFNNTLKGNIIRGALTTAPQGAAFGALDQLQQKGTQATRSDVLQGAAMGGVVGAGLGAAGPLVMRGASRLARLPGDVRANAARTASSNSATVNIPTNRLTSYEGAPDRTRVDFYKNRIQSGKPVEPIYAMRDSSGRLGIEDGKHRYQAYRELGVKRVPVKEIDEGNMKAVLQGGYIQLPGRNAEEAPLSSPESLNSYIKGGGKVNAFQRLSPAYQDAIRSGAAEPQPPRSRLLTPEAPRPDAPVIPEPPRLPEPLPSYGTKRVGNLDKAFRSTRSIIERQGEAGRELAGGLQTARDVQELYLSELQKAMPTVTKLARKGKNALVNKDFENFVDAAQGLAEPRNAKVAQAVAEWKATHPGIRERAVAAGLDVGDLGPDYYPHFIDYDQVFKDRNTYNEAINHLVKTGQAPSQEEAIKLLGYARDVSRNREFGNLEASRLVDLPFYDKTPNSLTGYLSGSTKRIANTETFGKKDEKALKLISKIGQEGGDTEAAKNAFDVAVGAKRYGDTSENISKNIRKYVTTTRLGLGALTNVSQNVNTGIVTGHLRTMGSMLKQLSPKTREFVADTGVVSDALLNDLRTQRGTETFTSKVLGKMLNRITAPGFGAVEKFNRSVAATAGRDYALRLAQRGNQKALRKLGVTGEIKNKTLTEAQQIQAARKIVEKTQFKVDPQDLPGWVDSPGGKLVAQFRTFSYNQGKFFSNEILKPAAKGNVLPLSRLLAALPLGYALYETRRAIDARPEEEDKAKVGLQSFSKVGGAGLALDIYQGLNPVGSKYLPSDRRVTMAVGALGGPAAGIAASGVGGVSEAIQQKNVPKDETRLEGKVAVKNNEGDKYNDLTPLSRFGLQQIPIVGTATANRVLPYKKQAEADEGRASKKKAAQADMSPRQRYESALKSFNEKSGKYSEAERFKKEKELSRLKVRSNFDQDVIDLYGMSKSEIYSFVTTNKNGKSLAEKLKAYDDALVKAGLRKSSKFKYGFASSGKGGKGGKGRKKSNKGKFDYKLFGFGGKPTGSGNLKQLLEAATVKKGKA